MSFKCSRKEHVHDSSWVISCFLVTTAKSVHFSKHPLAANTGLLEVHMKALKEDAAGSAIKSIDSIRRAVTRLDGHQRL